MTRAIAVLDTNVVLDLFYWHGTSSPGLLRLLDQIELVTDLRCLHELHTVLDRLCADPARVAAVLDDYRAHSRCVTAAPAGSTLPRCKDHQDQKFLELAALAGARWLITRDKALLALRRRKTLPAGLAIAAPDQAAGAIAAELALA
ncbi:MAG: putative toxin-antitoxin system toxin component, PIN family [Rhodocyclaceae bacterium]|nr:putative toxin-antitoxin system toxin component, PIN family [Rhodocyclaceae bacterium]